MIHTPSKALQVLVVDDSVGNRRAMRAILSSAGAVVSCVENGRDGVDAAAGAQFDLILIDMAMPVMDGLTAVQKIRAFERACRRPGAAIFMVTSHDEATDKAAAVAAGADGHIAKPFKPLDILTAADSAADRRLVAPGPRAVFPAPRSPRRTSKDAWAWVAGL